MVDSSFRPLSDNAHINFVNQQRDNKVALERFSPAFGPDLFPGMTSIPIGVVPKPHSDKLHLIVDQSSGDHSLNSFISREHIAVPLDNLHSLGTSLINVCVVHGMDIHLVVFKSDMYVPSLSVYPTALLVAAFSDCHYQWFAVCLPKQQF